METKREGAGLVAYGSLIAVTAIWGASFVWVKETVAVYPVFPFLALRFTLGGLLVGALLGRRMAGLTRGAALGGFWMGLALFGGYALQTLGLRYTTAAHSGFITGLFVVFTPLFEAALTRRPPRALTAAGVTLASGGLALLAWQDGWGSFNAGDLLSVGCAAVYAVHLLVTSRMSRRFETAPLVAAQLATVAALSWLASLPGGGAPWPVPVAALWGIGVTAVFATALAYFVQTAFQRRVPPIQTALIFTLEPVFAGLFAVLLGGEALGWNGVLGGALIVAGMLAGEAGQRRNAPPAAPVGG